MLKKIIDEFTVNIEKYQSVTSPETENLFNMEGSNPLNKNKAELFHTSVFIWKRARPYIHPIIEVLCTRLKQPNLLDWKN